MEQENNSLDIENVILKRIEGIKLRRPDIVRDVVDADLYSRFDDWPPGMRSLGEEALRIEEGALKVLQDYKYAIKDLIVKVIGNVAISSFYIHYDGKIRMKTFNIISRVSIVLKKNGSKWRIIHEHFSIIPENIPLSEPKTNMIELNASVKQKDELKEVILNILGDGRERHIADITQQASKMIGREVTASEIRDKCDVMASKKIIKRRGRFYPRYIIIKNS